MPELSLFFNRKLAEPDSKSKKLAAFHTITTMLASIQQECPFHVSTEDQSKEDLWELKIYNAICTLAIIEHEIVALVAKLEAQELQVILCTKLSDDDYLLSSTQSPQPTTHFPQIWDIIATRNLHREDHKKANLPCWITPKALTGLEHMNLQDKGNYKKLKDYMDQHCWWVWTQRKEPCVTAPILTSSIGPSKTWTSIYGFCARYSLQKITVPSLTSLHPISLPLATQRWFIGWKMNLYHSHMWNLWRKCRWRRFCSTSFDESCQHQQRAKMIGYFWLDS